MRTLKKLAAVVAALALTVGMTSTCFAASNWGSYFGQNSGWYEGAMGSLSKNTSTGWTATIKNMGWGGCWGGQVYLDNSKKDNAKGVDIVKGQKYTIKCTLKSKSYEKYIFIKVAKGDTYAFGKWVKCPKGKTVTVNETFTAKASANSIYFGIGGDFGDRQGVATDKDAKTRYSYSKPKDDANNMEIPNTITCTDFSLSSSEATTTAASTNTTVPGETSQAQTTTVATGDFTPIACGAAAIIAAAAIVVFARKRDAE